MSTTSEPLAPGRVIAPGVRQVKNLFIPMRDGVRLAADVYAPEGAAGPLPVVMEYLPYRKDEVSPARSAHYLALPRHGYHVVRVDIRGTGGSEGVSTDEYSPLEQQDGYDAIEWLAAQPWCDGHVNMLGISYGGFTSLQVAAQQPPHLTSIIPVDFTDDRYTDDCHYRGGLLRMYYDPGWYGTRMTAWNAMPPDPDWSGGEWARVWEQHLAANEPYLLPWLRHQTDGPYWRPGSVRDFPERIQCACFLVGGWRDGYPNPPLRLYEALVAAHHARAGAATRAPVKVLVGPWNHNWPDAAIPGPCIDFWPEVARWLDYWCKGAANGVMDEPPVVVYMQHWQAPEVDRLDTLGAWRAETSWPAPGAREVVWHLGAGGGLSPEVGPAQTDTYAYHAGVGVTGGLWSGGVPYGLPGDQRPDEAYALNYTTPPFTEPQALLGWPRVVLHFASSARVMGVFASLSDVAPDGSSHLIAKGALNATRRASLSTAAPLEPGAVVELTFDIDCLAWEVAPGHRLRLSIASADFPNVWPTPEPGVNQVWHGAGRPSRLILPVAPLAGSAPAPVFAPSPVTMTAHTAAVHLPHWEVRYAPLTGRVTSQVTVNQAFRVSPAAVIEREFSGVCTVDPHDPARASVRGWHVCRVVRAEAVLQGRADTLIQGTATHLHLSMEVEVRVNDAVHFSRRWTESVPRQWL